MFETVQAAFLTGIILSLVPMYYFAHKYYKKGLTVGRRQGFERGLKENISSGMNKMVEKLKAENPDFKLSDIESIKVINADDLKNMNPKDKAEFLDMLASGKGSIDNPKNEFEKLMKNLSDVKDNKDKTKLH